MRVCPKNDSIHCSSQDDRACAGCLASTAFDLKEETTGKKLKTRNYNYDCLAFVTDQVEQGVSFEEAVGKIGYYPELFTPPNCGSNVRVPKGQNEVLLEQLLEEVKRIKLILTVGK